MARIAELYMSDIGDDICSPFIDKSGNLYAVLQNSGEIVSATGQIETVHSTGGQPSGALFDTNGVMYIADFAHGSILAVQPDGQQDVVVGVYEDKPMKGPHSVSYSPDTGSLFFTDSGPFGETGLHSPTGSVFAIVNSSGGQILKPISLSNLAYPTGVAVGPDGSVYVAEMMMNRIIRFIQMPEGVFHGSVFCQLSGSMGPSAIAVDSKGNLYVAQFEPAAYAKEGSILILTRGGKEHGVISVPGPEISGLAISGRTLYITEKSTASIYKYDIRS